MNSGRGRLRITAVNPSLLPERSVAPAPSPIPPAPIPAPVPIPAPDPEKVIAAANAQLEDVGGFIKEYPQSPKLLDYIDRIGALSAAVKTNDPAEIERKLTELNDSLSHDREYQQHLSEQIEAQKRRAAQYLGDAIRRGEQERDFALDYIGKNPLADNTTTFAGYVKELKPALQKRLIPLTQVHLHVVAGRRRRSDFCSGFRAR